MISASVLIYKRDDEFVAHCLEFDIVATGPTVEMVQTTMRELIAEQLFYAYKNDNFEYIYHPAPPEVWARFFAAQSPKHKPPEWYEGLDVARQTITNGLALESVYAYA